MSSSLVSLTAIAALFLGTAACDQDAPPTGRVQIALTDAPGDGIRAAFVQVSEVYLQGEGGRVTLRETPVLVDLLTLSNSAMILAEADVPTGAYQQLRLVIDGAWVEVEGEAGFEVYATPGFEAAAGGEITGHLKTPSWSASGLKLALPDGRLEVDGDQRVLIVDFDVAESFQTATGDGDWVMAPIVAVNEIGLTTSIVIEAHVGIGVALDGPIQVELIDREGFTEGTLELSDPDGDGTFSATFVYVDPAEGPFSARVLTAGGLELTTAPTTIAIVGASGQTVTYAVDVVLAP